MLLIDAVLPLMACLVFFAPDRKTSKHYESKWDLLNVIYGKFVLTYSSVCPWIFQLRYVLSTLVFISSENYAAARDIVA